MDPRAAVSIATTDFSNSLPRNNLLQSPFHTDRQLSRTIARGFDLLLAPILGRSGFVFR
jgi:hypothetical protein